MPTDIQNSTPDTSDLSQERADLLDTLHKHRGLFLHTVRDLTDQQAAATPTTSSLSLGGLVKHLTGGERQWISFVLEGPAEQPDVDWASVDWSNPPPQVQAHLDGLRMLPGERLADLVADYETAAAETDRIAREHDLDAAQPLPRAPWFEPGARWSTRRVLMHLVAETAQHAGHADIIRETIDGQQTMS